MCPFGRLLLAACCCITMTYLGAAERDDSKQSVHFIAKALVNVRQHASTKTHQASHESVASIQRDRNGTADLDEICQKPLETNSEKWNTMASFANVLNAVKAPWNIHGGLLLGLRRGCYIFDSDLDFAVERQWLQSNHAKFEEAMTKAGFNQDSTLGDIDKQGYEEKFYGGSAATASVLQLQAGRQNVRLVQNTSGVPIDIFGIDRFNDHYEWFLWASQSKIGKCITKSTGTKSFSWLGTQVNVPVPVEDVLTSAYGTNFMKKHDWQWDREPFTIGSCRLQRAPATSNTFPGWLHKYMSAEKSDTIEPWSHGLGDTSPSNVE